MVFDSIPKQLRQSMSNASLELSWLQLGYLEPSPVEVVLVQYLRMEQGWTLF